MSSRSQDFDNDEGVIENDNLPMNNIDYDTISANSQGSQGRGRPRIIESWTRVISMEHDDLDALRKYPLGTDLLVSQNLPRTIIDVDKEGWQPHFLAKDFIRINFGINTENFKLDEKQLFDFGKKVTDIRKTFRERAESLVEEHIGNLQDAQKQLKDAIKKIRSRKSTQEPKETKLLYQFTKAEPNIRYTRRLRGRKGRLSVSDKISIAFSVICDGEFIKDIAKQYQVTSGFVSRLVKKVKLNPDIFDEARAKKDEKDRERAFVAEKIAELNKEDQVIKSIPSLEKYLKENFNIEKKPWELAKILKEDLGMQY